MTHSPEDVGATFAAFAEAVSENPTGAAVEFGNRKSLTYAEVYRLVQEEATLLRAAGVRQGSRVLLDVANRSRGVLGYLTLQSVGAVPVPADLTRGVQDRIDSMIQDTGASHRYSFGQGTESSIAAIQGLPEPPSESEFALDYVLFTSGTTGRPKGVPISRDNVRAYVAALSHLYPERSGARVSATFDLTFDLSVHDMLLAWTRRATLVFPGVREVNDPVRYITRRQLTHWFSVPSMIRLLPSGPPARNLEAGGSSLEIAMFCGEALRTGDALAWRGIVPASRLLNLYGPTEMTISCISHEVTTIDTSRPTIPIGRPYPGVEVSLDERGALSTAGPQRFPGYLRDGTVQDPGSVWYETGDLVRHHPAGLEFVGRADDQLKVRGFRIEPLDVEHGVSVACPHLGGVVVVERDGELLALHTGGADTRIDRAAVGEHLPSYMIPDRFVRVEALPMNGNGKVDRAAASRMVEKQGLVT
ncbi:AMP-binding protein [Kineosporia sp. J2-2]|uniref:AMP-binding protein n=1 Tax=Kineosporia corallincola TaxID=2835133 RepID=A0ABS5TJQ3_9ACTN|nr:AMP-binding protein [Kineosporia corallincola]MBT0770293.1 AMP-binding protein [Kineosporia corallincola]